MKNFVNFLSVFLVIGISIFLLRNPSQLEVLSQISFFTISGLIFIKFLTLLINSFFNKELLQGFKLQISNFEAIYLGSLTFLGNLFLPLRSGGNFRMLYLNKKYKFKTPELASMYIYFFVITIFLNSLIGLICLLYLDISRNIIFIISALVFLFMFFISTFLLIKQFRVDSSKDIRPLVSWIMNLKINWNIITNNKKLQFKLIFLTFINYLFFAIEAFIVINFLFSETNLFTIFYYNSVSVLSSLASVTPASLGVKDLIVVFSSDILNLTINNVITLMIVERAVSILFSLIPGGILLFSRRKII